MNGDLQPGSKQVVVLLHGIGHSMWNMFFIENILKDAGYETFNLSYPSRKHDIRTLTKWLNDQLDSAQIWHEADCVHFVCHSMGGLVTGFYLQNYQSGLPAEKMGRVVMLGTPHGGSEVADFLCSNALYKIIFGPAGQELTTHIRKNDQIQPWYDLGIIAGSHNWAYPFGFFCIKERNDGCVSIDSSKLDGMKDHIVLPVLHGLMGWKPSVHKQIIHFLKSGNFSK
jgi:pimeloyl-ACP methyl ester carboxylesterase